MNMNDMTNRLRKIEKEIEEYQTMWKHENQQVKMTKTNEIRKVCTRCEKSLAWPTKQELDEFLKGK